MSPAYPKELRTLGNHLRKRRLDLGLLQRDAAAQLGADEGSVYNWEVNRTVPALRFIPRIVEFLGYLPFPLNGWLPERLKASRQAFGLSQKRGAQRPSGRWLVPVEAFLARVLGGAWR